MEGYIPPRETIIYPRLDPNDLGKEVVKVAIVGLAVIPGDPPDSVYHFRFSLIFADGYYVRLDNNPFKLTDPVVRTRGQLEIDSSDEVTETDTIAWRSEVSRAVTAGDILRFVLVEKKREQYDFDDNGEGCRTWCEAVLKDLIEMGVMSDTALDSFNAWEKDMKIKRGYRIPVPRPTGTSYN